jgi:hypothetical protein
MTDEQAWARWQQQGKGRLTLTEAEQQRFEEIRFRVQEAAPVNLYADRKWLLSLIQRLTQPEA